MKTFRHASLFQKKIESVNQPSRYRLYAYSYGEAPYDWGAENLMGTDCSGLLCGPLVFMGFNIRVTADTLFKRLFTDFYEGYDDSKVQAAFLIDSDGKARHCGLVVGPGVVMHASGERGVVFNNWEDLADEYKEKGMDIVFKTLDWAKAYEMDGEVYDLDTELI